MLEDLRRHPLYSPRQPMAGRNRHQPSRHGTQRIVREGVSVRREGRGPGRGGCKARIDFSWTGRGLIDIIGGYQLRGAMDTARLFQSGRSQAVRLPKEYRFAGTEVVVQHFGNGVLLLPADNPWQTLQAGLAAFEPGFVLTRQQPEEQVRVDVRPDLGS